MSTSLEFCDISLVAIDTSNIETVTNRFKITQSLEDVIQFAVSKNLIQNQDVAILRESNKHLSFDNFNTTLMDVCQAKSSGYIPPHLRAKPEENNNKITTRSFTIITKDYVFNEIHAILNNLLFRYNLGIMMRENPSKPFFVTLDKNNDEYRRKSEALAQRTILENFELREMVNESRDENFHLKNEMYELNDKLEKQYRQINKLILPYLPAIDIKKKSKIPSYDDLVAMQVDIGYGSEIVTHEIFHNDEFINHLIMQYDLGILPYNNKNHADEEEYKELMYKAAGLAQRVIMENHELRGMVDELKGIEKWLKQVIEIQMQQVDKFVLLTNKLLKDAAEINVQDIDDAVVSKTIEAMKKEIMYTGYDWNKNEEDTMNLINGVIRGSMEKQKTLIIPQEINLLIAKYSVYIFAIITNIE